MKDRKLNWIEKLFCYSAGSHASILERCPTQIAKHMSIGGILWITAMVASMSGGYFFLGVFGVQKLAVLFGLIWGCIIFLLDRYIMINLIISDSRKRNLLMATPRIILALLLGLVMAKPIELRIFEKEIAIQAKFTNAKDVLALKSSTRKEMEHGLKWLTDEEASITDELERQKEVVRLAEEDFYNEVNGISTSTTTGRKQYGPRAAEKDTVRNRANQRLMALQRQHDDIQKQLLEKQSEASNTEETAGSTFEGELNGPMGPMRQLQMLSTLAAWGKPLFWPNLAITLIFILIELAPVTVKLFSSRGVYEEMLELEEAEKKSQVVLRLEIIRHETKLETQVAISNINRDITLGEELRGMMKEERHITNKETIRQYETGQRDDLSTDLSQKMANLVEQLDPKTA